MKFHKFPFKTITIIYLIRFRYPLEYHNNIKQVPSMQNQHKKAYCSVLQIIFLNTILFIIIDICLFIKAFF